MCTNWKRDLGNGKGSIDLQWYIEDADGDDSFFERKKALSLCEVLCLKDLVLPECDPTGGRGAAVRDTESGRPLTQLQNAEDRGFAPGRASARR